jgi:GNAT superfamily N-acetyltransferase
MSVDRELIETWLTGWARARDVGQPADLGDCWRVEIGWPSQKMRYVFPLPSRELPNLAATITDPLIYLKAFVTADAMTALLPPGWAVEPQCVMMLLDDLNSTQPVLPAGYRLEQGGRNARILYADAVVASGQVVEEKSLAVFVGIKVDAAHRRRGLGRAVMGALTAMARDLDARRGALVATQEGQALYQALGWRDYAPYVSAFPNIQR